MKQYETPGIPFRIAYLQPGPVSDFIPSGQSVVTVPPKIWLRLLWGSTNLQNRSSFLALLLGAQRLVLRREVFTHQNLRELDVINDSLASLARDLAALATTGDGNRCLAWRANLLRSLIPVTEGIEYSARISFLSAPSSTHSGTQVDSCAPEPR